MARSPQDIYARHLSSRRGYPLWTPDPSQQFLLLRREGLRIWDVGIVVPDDGYFDVFFNACLPQDHVFHRANGVPDNFQHIVLNDMDIRTTVNAENPGRVLANSSVKSFRAVERPTDNSPIPVPPGLEYEFTLSSSEGALLILPEGALRHDLRNNNRFLEAAIQHGASWYRFAEERVGQTISNDALYLITGLYQTTSWSLAAFERSAGSAEYPERFRVCQGGRDNIATTCTWETARALDWRSGPHQRTGHTDQTVFIRGYKIALRTGMFGNRWITVGADAPSTRPNPPRSFGAIPGKSWLAYMFSGLSTGSITRPSGSSMQDVVAVEPAFDIAQDETQNKGTIAVGEDVVVRRVPEPSKPFHPSDIINRYLLNMEPSANIAITHDDDWISMLEENLLQPEDLAKEGHLETLVSQVYEIISRGDVVYLQKRRYCSALTARTLSDFTTNKWGDFRRGVRQKEDDTARSSVLYNDPTETHTPFYSPSSSPEGSVHHLPAPIADRREPLSWTKASQALVNHPCSPSPPLSMTASTPSLNSGYDTPLTVSTPGTPASPIPPNRMTYFDYPSLPCRMTSTIIPQVHSAHHASATDPPRRPLVGFAHSVARGTPQPRLGGPPAAPPGIQASIDFQGRPKGVLRALSQMNPPLRAMHQPTLSDQRSETRYDTFNWASPGTTQRQMPPPPITPLTSGMAVLPSRGLSQGPTHGEYTTSLHPPRQPPRVNHLENVGDASEPARRRTDNTDRVDPFAEGPHYGPVLEPLLAKIVGANIKLNPLLAPPRDMQSDHLRWNMVFHTTRCYLATEPQRPWANGRNAPATHPRLASIRIISRSFPWTIHARAQDPKLGVACEEVLDAISSCMYEDATRKEFEGLPAGRKRQISENYRVNRSTDSNASGGRLGEALKRLDWLGNESKFGGLVVNEAFVRERCGDPVPCTFELQCAKSYPLESWSIGKKGP